MAQAASILFEINSTNYSTGIFTIYKPPLGYSGFVTTLRLTIDIKSIATADFPYIPDDTPPNVLQEILDQVALNTPYKEVVLFYKKGDGAWIQRAPIRIFNKEPFYDVNLMRFYSDANTIDVADDFSLGIQLRLGNVLVPSVDKIAVWGSVVEEKKNNGNEELAARIESLELALAGRLTDLPANTLLGRGSFPGVAEFIPTSNFVTPVQSQSAIEQAIFDLAGAAPAALNTLAELAAAFGNDPNFAATITALIATKAVLNLSLQLTNRSGATGVFDANAWVLTFFAGFKWLDGGVTNLNLPPGLNTGMILQFDPLLIYPSVAAKYLVQIFFSGTRLFFRIQNIGTWGAWREIATTAV